MKFRQLALRNVLGNWHQYSAFFLSSVFSVMIFYIYASFIFHPDVINGHLQAASKVRQGLVLCDYIIIVFSFFFVLYSNSAFLKSRKKEFGLFSLFGMTNAQLRLMVLYENVIIAVLAIAAGIGFGTLFSRLFFMAMAELLQVHSPIRFAVPPKALLTTSIGFFALFLTITLFSLIRVGRTQIVELLAASKKPKTVPIFSKWLVLVSLICLGAGYYLAYTMTSGTLLLYMLPILTLVMIGTYFLFTQSSVAVLNRMQGTPSFYFKNTNMLTVSQLVYKMKDNARILFMVSILSAVVLTASGTFYVFYQGGKEQVMENYPQTFGYMEKGTDHDEVIDPAKVESILKKHGADILYKQKLEGVEITAQVSFGKTKADSQMLIISEEMYNQHQQAAGESGKQLQIQAGHAVFLYPFAGGHMQLFHKGDRLTSTLHGKPLELKMDGQLTGAIHMPSEYLLIIDNKEYESIMSGVPASERTAIIGYELKDWEKTGKALDEIEQAIPKNQRGEFSSRVRSYQEMMQMSSLTLFVGVFVSLLFFIASGSMIYFKLFTEIEEDQAHFRMLTRIGMTSGEMKRIVTTQVAMIFFIPCIVGIIHTTFAMKSLGNVLFVDVKYYAALIFAIFLVMQTAYFVIARRGYLKRILQAVS